MNMEKLIDLLQDHTEVKVEPKSLIFDDLSIGSLDMMVILYNLEEKGLVIDFQRLKDVKTVENLFQYCREQLKEN